MFITCPACLTDNLDNSFSCLTCGMQLASSGNTSTYHLPSGTLLKKKYQIEKTLGEGGFGITYKGIDCQKSLTVAIKELWPEKAVRQGVTVTWPNSISPVVRTQQLKKFQLEADYLSRCVHPNIAKVYEWFEENNTAYIVMEFIPGKSLYEIMKEEGLFNETRLKNYSLQVAEALTVVHTNNLLHRDIKPENILINAQDRAVLIDFGATREFIAGQTGDMTQVLTPGYAPYEQYSKISKRFPATDFYALCASMYELLTGQVPVDASERASALIQGNADVLTPPRQLRPNLSPLIEQVILTGMRINVSERFQTADELIDALKGKFVSPKQRQAQQLVSQGKLAEAVQAYEQCLANEPSNGEAAVELSLVLIYLNDIQAEVAANKAIQLKPNDGRSYGILGLINCRKSNFSAAVRQLQQAANLSPNQAWIQANLAWALGKLGKWQNADVAVNHALQLDNNSTFALGLQSWIAVNQQQWKPAIRAARQAITKSKQTNFSNSQELQSWVYPCLTVALNKAVITQQANDVDRCLQEFSTQVPNSAFAWSFKGWKQASIGLWREAVDSWEKATHQVQVPAWAWVNLGIAYEHHKNLQAAIQAYETYNLKFPSNAFIQFRIGTLLAQQGQWSQAKSLLEKSLQLQPDYAEAQHNLAWVLLNIKNPDGQVQNFREMLSTYRQASALYAQQQKYDLSQSIKQAFQDFGVNL